MHWMRTTGFGLGDRSPPNPSVASTAELFSVDLVALPAQISAHGSAPCREGVEVKLSSNRIPQQALSQRKSILAGVEKNMESFSAKTFRKKIDCMDRSPLSSVKGLLWQKTAANAKGERVSVGEPLASAYFASCGPSIGFLR